MEIPIHKDGNGQLYVEWSQGYGGYKRAWIRRPTDPEKDWGGRRTLPQRGSREGTSQRAGGEFDGLPDLL